MWVDIVFLIVLIMAVIKGASRGITMALFSFIGYIIGLAAALKLSAVVAVYLQSHTDISSKWLPLLSFILVFIVIVLLIQWAGKAVENLFEFTLLGWVNRLGGALLYAGMYILVGSILLFYADQMHLIKEDTLSASRAYGLTSGLAPAIIAGIGAIIPSFKNTFHELEVFFEKIGKEVSLNQ